MGVRRRLAVVIGSISWMPHLLPLIVKVDNRIQAMTGGRYALLDIADLPHLTMRVAGRKTGIPRSTTVLAVPSAGAGDESHWLIAGSYFGGPTMPAWVYNIRAAGDIEVVIDGEPRPARTVELTGDARSRAWRQMLEFWPNFDLYEKRTDRTIPVFAITVE